MGGYIARQLIKQMAKKNINIGSSRVLIMGLAFKENCPDIRNTRVWDTISELNEYGCVTDVYDPVVESQDVLVEMDIELISRPKENYYDAIIIAVAHDYFRDMGISVIRSFTKRVFDL